MQKNVAGQVIGAQMVNAADGTAFTGTATVVITVDGGTQSASGGTGPTHEGNGFHTYLPTQAETNGDHIGFTFTGSGAVPVTIQVYTEAARVSNRADVNVGSWNSVALATTNPLPNAAADAPGGLPISDAGGLDLDAALGAFVAGTVTDVGATNTVFVDSARSSTDDFYNGSVVAFYSGALKGVARRVSDYDGAGTQFTLAPALPTAPVQNDKYMIIGRIDA